MRVEYINTFISSLDNTFRTMLDCNVQRGQPALKDFASPKFDISGIIGLTGNAIGTVVLSLSEEVALRAASHMLMCDCTEINADVIDAVGELTNMVAGAAKSALEEFHMSVSLPNVITGHDHKIGFPSDVQPIYVPFTTKWGALTLEVGLSPVKEPALT
jgi:chemotaxis protein CheX